MIALKLKAHIFSLGLLLAVVPVGSAQASDWPQYKRDAARTANAADEALAFPLQRVLAVKFPSPIYASAAVVGGKVYAVDARGLVACIEAGTNRVAWTAEIGGVSNRSSPAVAGGKVFVGSTAGFLMVLDAATGKEVAKLPAEGGVIAAPAAANEAVYCLTFNGKMLKVDLSGKLVWTFDAGKTANGEFMVQGKQLIFWAGPTSNGSGHMNLPRGLYVVEDLGDRAERRKLILREEWEKKSLEAMGLTGLGIANGLVFGEAVPRGKDLAVAGDELGRICFSKLLAAGAVEKKPAWVYETSRVGKPNGGVSATAAISGGVVYVGGEDGILYGLGRGAEAQVVAVRPEAKNDPAEVRPGEKLKGPEWPTVGGDMGYSKLSPDKVLKPPLKIMWKTRIAGSGGQNGVIVAAGRMFVFSYNGFIEALDAETGEILWRNFQAGIARGGEYPNDGPPTYADGKLLVMRRNGLWCHDAKTGELLWRNPQPVLPVPGGAPQGDGQVVHEGKVLIAWQDKGSGIETAALELATGKEAWRTSHEWAVPPKPAGVKQLFVRVCQGALGEKTWFISAGVTRENGEGAYVGGITMALDPTNGKQLWKTPDKSIGGWGGLNYRNGAVVVSHEFTRGVLALDAKTGQPLWENLHGVGAGMGAWHSFPLTDEFLASQGRRGSQGGYCFDTVWVNGFFYGPVSSSSHALVARKPDSSEVWRYVVLSRGCPAPAPAYGRLYYAAFSEGVVYCFINKE